MTTLQRKFLQTAHAERTVGGTPTSKVDTLEDTVLLGSTTHQTTFVVLVDSLQNSSGNRALLDGVISRIWHECRQSELPIAQRLKNAIESANQFVREGSSQRGASVILIAITKINKTELVLQLVHIGNCRAYLLTIDSPQGATKREYQLREQRFKLVELNQVYTWGSRNVKQGLLTEEQKSNYPQWNVPLEYVGVAEGVTAEINGLTPNGWERTLDDGFKLKAQDKILCVTNVVSVEQIRNVLQTGNAVSAQALADKIVGKADTNQPSDATAVVIRQKSYTKIDWTMAVRNSLLTLFGGLRWLVLLALLVGLLYTAWWYRYAPVALIAYLPRSVQPTVVGFLPPTVQAVALATLLTPTPTVTVSQSTPTPLPSPTAPALSTSTPFPTLTNTPTNTQSPTVIVTQIQLVLVPPNVPPTPTPTPTPAPTATPTRIPTATATLVPTATATSPDISSTLTPLPSATLSPSRVITLEVPVGGQITLLSPDAGWTATGRVSFVWSTNFALPQGYAFELIFWRRGEDPFANGRGWKGTSNQTRVEVNFDDLLPQEAEGEYLWGVRLVQVNPYAKSSYLWGERQIIIKSASEPEPTKVPCLVIGCSSE